MLYGTVSTAMSYVLVLQDVKTCVVLDSFYSHVLCVSPAGCGNICCTRQFAQPDPVCWSCTMCKRMLYGTVSAARSCLLILQDVKMYVNK